MRVHVSVHPCVSVWVGVCKGEGSCLCACSLTNPACDALPYCHLFSVSTTLSHKRHDFRKNVFEHKMFNFIFSTSFISNIFNSKKYSRDIIINVKTLSRKVAVILVRF